MEGWNNNNKISCDVSNENNLSSERTFRKCKRINSSENGVREMTRKSMSFKINMTYKDSVIDEKSKKNQ